MIAKTHEPKSISAPALTARVAPTSPLILLREDVESIAILTLNRPEARNSLSEALLAALVDAFTAIAQEPSVRAVVLAANGSAFSAGQGVATAAGCQLVASCDLAVASAAAKFATPGVNIGLFCSTPMVALSRNVSRKHAMQMLLTGDLISAEDAARIGLVNQVVPAGQERGAALQLAEKIAAKSTLTVKIGKEAFYRQAEMSLADAY